MNEGLWDEARLVCRGAQHWEQVMIENRARTWDDLKTITPDMMLYVDGVLEARIEKCLNVTKRRPHIPTNQHPTLLEIDQNPLLVFGLLELGGGAMFCKEDMHVESEAYSVFQQIEQQHPGYTLFYNDKNHVGYSYVSLVETFKSVETCVQWLTHVDTPHKQIRIEE